MRWILEQFKPAAKRKCSFNFTSWAVSEGPCTENGEGIHPLHHYISMQVLLTVLYTLLMVLKWRICLTIKSFLGLLLFP